MHSLNKVYIIGRLGHDIDLRRTKSEDAIVNFSLATNETYGGVEQPTEWHKCTAWKKTAELLSELCQKGDRLFIEGRLHSRSWEKDDGSKQVTTEIVVANFIKL